jgi:hypothetical protein
MTTTTTAIAPNVKTGKRKRRLPQIFRTRLVAGLEMIADDIFEAVGGKDYIAALFANNVLGDRSSRKGGSEVKTTIHKGAGKYAKRRYRIKKKGGGKYEVERA